MQKAANSASGASDSAYGYIFGKMQNVRGYLDPGDALMLSTIMDHQNSNGLSGGAAEIGVLFGRSYFLIRELLREGEEAFAADLFNIGAEVDGRTEQYRQLLESAHDLGMEIDETLVHRGDSKALSGADITGKVGPVRLFSVDGGHMLHHVSHDAAVARDALSDHGVIAFDDAFNFEWPEVTLGIFRFLEENPAFLPFAITQKKMYVCKASFHAQYVEAIKGASSLSRLKLKPGSYLGTPVVFVHHKMTKRIAHAALSKVGAQRLARTLYQ